jgi:hypothetical protein
MHRKIDSSLRRNLPRGSPGYEPPEARTEIATVDFSKLRHKIREGLHINEAHKHVTPAANVWAFAAILWELMTMRDITELSDRVNACTPLRGAPRKGMITDEIMTPMGDNPPRYSPALVQIIRWCLRWHAADRPTVSELEDHLRAFAGPGPYRPTCDEDILWTNERPSLLPRHAHKMPWPLNEGFWREFWNAADYWNEKDPEIMPPSVNGRVYQHIYDSHRSTSMKSLWQQRFTGIYPPPINHKPPKHQPLKKERYQAYKPEPNSRPQTPKRKRYENESERKRHRLDLNEDLSTLSGYIGPQPMRNTDVADTTMLDAEPAAPTSTKLTSPTCIVSPQAPQLPPIQLNYTRNEPNTMDLDPPLFAATPLQPLPNMFRPSQHPRGPKTPPTSPITTRIILDPTSPSTRSQGRRQRDARRAQKAREAQAHAQRLAEARRAHTRALAQHRLEREAEAQEQADQE